MKTKQVVYGIEITKPWSKAMYAHNDKVAEFVKLKVSEMWKDALNQMEAVFEGDKEDEFFDREFLDLGWVYASEEMIDIQRAVNLYRFGMSYTIEQVAEEVEKDLNNAPYYRLKEIAEELELNLEQEFIGLK